MKEDVMLTDKNTSGKVLDHLGLVMSTIDHLKIIEKIDARIPLCEAKNPKTTIGQRVAAMLLNALGFVDNRLYMFPEFMSNKPVSRLLGKGVQAEYFNDDSLGRCLDKISDYGITKLFAELAFSIGAQEKFLGKSAHFDTTTLSVYGEYENAQEEQEEKVQNKNVHEADSMIEKSEEGSESCEPEGGVLESPYKSPTITHGFSKDHRPDLKQVVLNLATTGAAGFPIWMEAHSGNASDQKELRAAAERMQKFCKELKQSPSFMYVADSAIYDSCIEEGKDLRWLSRVPERIKWAKELLQYDDKDYAWKELRDGYKICIVENKYKEVIQRLCIVSSEQAYKREIKTFERNLQKQQEQHEQALWHLSNQEFGCIQDAEKSVKKFNKGPRYHQLEGVTFKAIKKYVSKGRPKKGETKKVIGYKIKGKIVELTDIIQKTRLQKGRFILATNELDRNNLADNKILEEYKEQSKTESGFRFIKDDAFEVSSIFLKKPSRIAALMMIMTLCLMVHSVAQHQLRKSLEKFELSEIDPQNKLRKKATMIRVFKLFHGVHELTVQLGKTTQCLIINLSDLAKAIIRCFGGKALLIYELAG